MTAVNAHAAIKFADCCAHEWRPFRPVQYLGSKLRALEQIRAAARELVHPGARIADLFTGSTVVAQHFASHGSQVSALDTQRYAQIFATALLGVGRARGEVFAPLLIVNEALNRLESRADSWRTYQAAESAALEDGNAPALRRLYTMLPLAWSPSFNGQAPSIASVYAGTYFGVKQAREIDALRASIRDMSSDGRLSCWQTSVALTGLMHAASMAVHSAGKHFAQPLRFGSKNESFLNSRLLADRSISLADRFAEGCRQAAAIPFSAADGHAASQGSAEDFVRGDARGHDLYYLDPPYTAQQYSRFYHLLETLSIDGIPELPPGEKVSAGLYPSNRYKSAFSSRRKAPAAMEAVLARVGQRRAAALVSYSSSARASNGNARMISLDELLSICCRIFGTSNVECSTMGHRYRQFNSGENAKDSRDDTEILILCKSA